MSRLPVHPRVAAVAIVACVLACPASVLAACAIKTMELPVRMVDGRAIANVAIDGTPVPLMVDTGSFFSMLTESAASQLNLRERDLPNGLEVQGLTGRVRARMTTVSRLQLSKGAIPDVDFVVGGNEPGAGAMGLMGRNMLAFTDTEFDLAHGIVRFVFPSEDCAHSNMAYWAGETPVAELELRHPFRERTPEISADIELNGQRVRAVFDSGASTLVSLRAAHRVGVKDADMTPAGKAFGVGSGRADTWNAAFDKIDFGGEAILHNRLEVADFEMHEDMLIGIDFFLSHHIYVSKSQSKMYFTYNGGPVFALNQGKHESPSPGDAAPLKADELARRGAASLARGDVAGALADLDRACALEPGNGAFLAQRATIHAAAGNGAQMLADLDAALRLDPALDDTRLLRARAREALGQRDEALADLAALDQRLAPGSDLRRGVATVYGELRLPARSLAEWDLWIPAHKHDVRLDVAYNARCWARVTANVDLPKALDDCDEAVDADSKNPSFLDSRAWVYLRQDKLKKALADFDRAVALRPDGAWSLYGRAVVHQRLDDVAAAQADLVAARQAEPGIDAEVGKTGLPTLKP